MAKRITRPAEERIAELEAKIQKQNNIKKAADQKIAHFEDRIDAIKNPRPRLTKAGKIKAIVEEAKKTMTPEEIAEKLGISFK